MENDQHTLRERESETEGEHYWIAGELSLACICFLNMGTQRHLIDRLIGNETLRE